MTREGGQERRYASAEPQAMQAVIRDRLRRRLSAPKRIGCPYQLAAFSQAPGFDATGWLPGDIMARFFSAQGDPLASTIARPSAFRVECP
jgi:hypothetical protein